MTDSVSIQGIQEAQRGNMRALAALQPSGSLGRAIKSATLAGHRYAVAVTHVDTGALRASHRAAVNGLRGEVYLDPDARNPSSSARTAIYGAAEHSRGGDHAFYARVEREYGYRIGQGAAVEFLLGVK